MKPNRSLSVYWAGDLFSHKALIGNAILADVFTKRAEGRYTPDLPQNIYNPTKDDPANLRNLSLQQIVKCDLSVFHFDGLELDSGTVVEQQRFSMLGKPFIMFRTDLRVGGDEPELNIPWNLMMNNFPRSDHLLIRTTQKDYIKSFLKFPSDVLKCVYDYATPIADSLITALDNVCKNYEPINNSAAEYEEAIRLYLKTTGSLGKHPITEDEIKFYAQRAYENDQFFKTMK